MKNIFVSRPTYIYPSQQDGLSNFLKYLSALELNPRTLGASDYPQQSPLDEVIKIMKECSGAIILGFPQIEINAGEIKNEIIKSIIKLPTEWNHIEAALAYEMKIPLLFIHDLGISRGIFDRGTLNAFIYEVDFSKNDWLLSDNIIGAIKQWKNRLDNISQPKQDTKDSTKRLQSLRNELLQKLNQSYYKQNKKSIHIEYEYTGYDFGNGIISPIKEFFIQKVDRLYDQNAKASGIKTMNELISELNKEFPIVYGQLLDLFDREGFNMNELDGCFNQKTA